MEAQRHVAEEYCWVITQAMGQSCCDWSGSSVWGLNFNWTSVCIHTCLTICVLNSELCKIGLVLYLTDCCMSRGVSVYCLAHEHVCHDLVLVVNDPVSHNHKCALLNTTVFDWRCMWNHQYSWAAVYVFPSQSMKSDKKLRIWDKMWNQNIRHMNVWIVQ